MNRLISFATTVLLLCTATPLMAQQQSAKPSKKKVITKPVPIHDPVDQPFRRAPMAAATRSVVIPLSTKVHLAFDADLLRTHVAWQGNSLNLFGPPYHDSSDRFICDFDGKTLWTTPQLYPWSVGTIGTSATLPAGSRFKGLSTKEPNGHTIVMYDIGIGEGKSVRVHEIASTRFANTNTIITRRIEVEPCSKDLFVLAHAERGTFKSKTAQATVIQRSNDKLLVRLLAAVGTNVTLVCTNEQVHYIEVAKVEKSGRGPHMDFKTNVVQGIEARVYVRIPTHEKAIAVELTSVVVADAASERDVQPALASGLFSTTTSFNSVRNSSASSTPTHAKTFTADKTIFPRVDGDKFYKIEHFPVPKEIDLKPTGMDFLPNGDLAVATWRGDIYIVQNAQSDVRNATYRRFACGLMEPGGLKIVNGQMYVTQKGELTRLTDTDNDGEADLFETINSDWGFTGKYNAFAFGPALDTHGNFYVFLGGNAGDWEVPLMGWAVKISPTGHTLEPFCSGLRVPNGFASIGDNIFVTENQGNWMGGCKINHLQQGSFYGYPSAKPAPKEQFTNPKTFSPPAVWVPYSMAKSSSGMARIEDDKLGPFKGQMLVGDFQMAIVTRVMMENVNGEWQGAIWPFAKGFNSGVNRIAMGPDGKAYVGGCKGAHWAAVGPQNYSLDRITYTGKTPFEIKEVHATTDGFDLVFTEPADPTTASKLDGYDVSQFTYEYHEKYGSPEFDHDGKPDSSSDIKVAKAALSDDHQKVHLTLEGLKPGFITTIRLLDATSEDGDPLRHDTCWYTLNSIPRK